MFNDVLRSHDFKFIADGVVLNSNDITADRYKFNNLDIIPLAIGEGGGNSQSRTKEAIGAGEIAVGGAIGFFTGWTGIGAGIGVDLIVAGVGTIAGTIITNLMKPKDYDKSADSSQSNIFNGPRNISKEGVAIPILYGRMLVGSLVASGYIAVKGQNL